ncbi:MAG: sulfatase [Planctomycetota bacterium]
MRAAALLSLLLLLSCSGGEEADGPIDFGDRRPVILISIDSLRADFTSPYGHVPRFAPNEVTTPFLNRMAAEGVVFERASAASSWTLPSHMSMLTGMNPLEHAIRSRKWSLNPDVGLVSNKFQRAGYATGGVFSAPFLHPVWGFHRGFDMYVPGPAYLGTLEAAEALAANRKSDTVTELHDTSHTDNRTAEPVIDKALAWLEEDRRYAEPFFLFLHLWDPHYDYFPPEDYRARFVPEDDGNVVGDELMKPDRVPGPEEMEVLKALYEAEIRYTDDQIARLWEQLEAWGIADAVIIAVTSDHGDEFLEHGDRGHHHTLYEEVIHVPLVLRAPGIAPAGVRVGGTVSNIDLAPTLLDLAGLEPWPNRSGSSLAPLWTEDLDRQVYLDLVRPAKDLELRGYRFGPAKGILDAERQMFRVYDLAQDPGELVPRSSDLANKADAFAVEALEFLLRSQSVRHKPGKVAETPAMTGLLSELGYTED